MIELVIFLFGCFVMLLIALAVMLIGKIPD